MQVLLYYAQGTSCTFYCEDLNGNQKTIRMVGGFRKHNIEGYIRAIEKRKNVSVC